MKLKRPASWLAVSGTAVVLLAAALAGTVYAASESEHAYENVAGYWLGTGVTVTDLGSGDYRGTTYGEADSILDRISIRITLEESCNGSWSIDGGGSWFVLNHDEIQQTLTGVQYANDLWDCPFGQAIANGNVQAARYEDSPSLDYSKGLLACLNIRAGGAC